MKIYFSTYARPSVKKHALESFDFEYNILNDLEGVK